MNLTLTQQPAAFSQIAAPRMPVTCYAHEERYVSIQHHKGS